MPWIEAAAARPRSGTRRPHPRPEWPTARPSAALEQPVFLVLELLVREDAAFGGGPQPPQQLEPTVEGRDRLGRDPRRYGRRRGWRSLDRRARRLVGAGAHQR